MKHGVHNENSFLQHSNPEDDWEKRWTRFGLNSQQEEGSDKCFYCFIISLRKCFHTIKYFGRLN